MHLETVALEDNFGTRRVADASKNHWHVRAVYDACRHQNIEADGQQPKARDVKLSCERHHGTYCPFNGRAVVAIHGAARRQAAKRWKGDIRPLILHDGVEVVKPLREHPVELAWEDCSISGNDDLALQWNFTLRYGGVRRQVG